ncbi:hypothetical protein DMUE_2350 [Dictyocoela muelleri]|nr:hypothetical protein DMUE_2350 [Dictyocoela muelleri]
MKTAKNTSEDLDISRKSVNFFYKKLRLLCHEYMNITPIILGGGGVICQIDETCFFHKPKYNRGCAKKKQICIFGIVDKSYIPDGGYMQIVPNESRQTFITLIERIVVYKSVIQSDEWASYRSINMSLYEQRTIRRNYILFILLQVFTHKIFNLIGINKNIEVIRSEECRTLI